MYQWVDPESGTTQLSGKPPAWYRSTESGPRTFVFDKGVVIDDTAIKVSDEQQELLRRDAFYQVEADREKARQKFLEAEKLKASMEGSESDEVLIQEPNEETYTEITVEDDKKTGDSKPDSDVITAEEMRALITAWEEKRTKDAKELLGSEDN